jgi:hypothetical protein
VKEIDTTESSSNDRVDIVAEAFDLDLGPPSYVREDIAFPEFNESKFDVVGMRRVVLTQMVRD